ncbi:MAG: type III-B CRISPR module RAMP protein Cmr4 [Deltaproteobacteria bacterium]|nr:type III-B CRISPR module RAMP protein Cmr4 [Deltaproteobacteria bacterium]
MASYEKFLQVGLALEPIHVGTGGTRIGRVDLSIVRDPVTQVPKIPGSSLAGVYRTYVAMAEHEKNSNRQINNKDWPIYPNCGGLGESQEKQAKTKGEKKYRRGHCGKGNCPVCTVFGFAKGKDQEGGFAGLAAFTDAHVLLFPVPTRQGPRWITCPDALRLICVEVAGVADDALYLDDEAGNPLNLGWLLLETRKCNQMDTIKSKLGGLNVPDYIRNPLALVPDRLFPHVVNSNLEVRTSVSINPETGAAEDKALFSYEALPRGTVLMWEIVVKNPQHFRIGNQPITAVTTPANVHEKARQAHPYLEHLGIGGMGTRGMGRVRVIYYNKRSDTGSVTCSESQPSQDEVESETRTQEVGGHE